MTMNPFSVTKAEEFNHSYDDLAALMKFRTDVADVLLSNSNVIVVGSRGSGKSMYLRLLSSPVKAMYETLSRQGEVDRLPEHAPFFGVYVKLAPTVFGPHEYEDRPHFRESFQHLFNVYCAEHLASTLAECAALDQDESAAACRRIAELILPEWATTPSLQSLAKELTRERQRVRQLLNELPYRFDERSQPDTLWQLARSLESFSDYAGVRVHFLIDEYDSLTPNQQRMINCYLRKRDFPVTFKIGWRKHCLVSDDADGRPLNPSGDFAQVMLDDDDFGLGGKFKSHLNEIANVRLHRAGVTSDIRSLLGEAPPARRPKAERRYSGFDVTAMLSSGIVRTFLELSRDTFSMAKVDTARQPRPISADDQDRVIKRHATNRWNVLARDQSARPELQRLVEEVALLFAQKSKGSEHQVIRLEIVDPEKMSTFLRTLLTQALEYEAFLQPNRERQQKNAPDRAWGMCSTDFYVSTLH